MGLTDWLRGRQKEPMPPEEVRAETRAEEREQRKPEPVSEELGEEAHEHRTEEYFIEPRKPPGTS